MSLRKPSHIELFEKHTQSQCERLSLVHIFTYFSCPFTFLPCTGRRAEHCRHGVALCLLLLFKNSCVDLFVYLFISSSAEIACWTSEQQKYQISVSVSAQTTVYTHLSTTLVWQSLEFTKDWKQHDYYSSLLLEECIDYCNLQRRGSKLHIYLHGATL